MKMYHAYSGRVRNGQPLISEAVTLPEDANLIIMVLNENPSISNENLNMRQGGRQARRAAFEEFFAAMSEIDDEPLDGDFDAIMAKRVNILRELDL